MKKKVDARIRALIDGSVKNNHRGMFVIVGDRGKDQVVNLHYMLSKAAVKARPSVLWCYKNELGFSSHRKKRMKQIKKQMQRGLLNSELDDPFELFVSSTKIRFTYYSETEKVLGNTFGMCVLQDFEALTPNLLARTVETVEGGGLVVILLRSMTSLKSLYSMAMDAHAKLKTEAHADVVARFNERFLLSLADNDACIVCDDELNILPVTSKVRSKLPAKAGTDGAEGDELRELKNSMSDVPIVGAILERTKTVDQAKAFLTFVETITEKTLRSTVSLTASRGRGKSAALGLAVAAAVAHEYSNIFVTSPSPENLGTFFEFLFVGFDALEYQEHTDYEILQSTNPAMEKCVVRVNIFRSHRQTVQYIEPQDAGKATQHAELFVVDEAAAIPLPTVRSLLGPYLIFLSSTITGYEGTGRSLSLKLIAQMRKRSAEGARELREVSMEAPVRYSSGDPVEKWLYDLLCLDAGEKEYTPAHAAAHPSKCDLYWVDRDALFSKHAAAEAFLRRVMSLFVSSHYKNSPNDLMMLSDAPAHELFVLLGPTRPDSDKLPDVLCAIQTTLEGSISKEAAAAAISRGTKPSGDLIPWTLSQQYQDPEVTLLSGVRIVRIATNPTLQGMGYGTRAIELLLEHYGNTLQGGSAPENGSAGSGARPGDSAPPAAEATSLLEERVAPRADIPPLLRRLGERPPAELDYVGVSFGLSQQLYRFWSKLGLKPLYVRLTPNEVTGEHTVIMLRELRGAGLFEDFRSDFRRRFSSLLGYGFRALEPGVALTILEDNPPREPPLLTRQLVRDRMSAFDERRLESYGRNLVDYHIIVDLLPLLAAMYFEGSFEGVSLSLAQRAILMALGLQRKSVEGLEKELDLAANQILALFHKVVRKLSKRIRDAEEAAVGQEMAETDAAADKVQLSAPLDETLEEDLQSAAVEQSKMDGQFDKSDIVSKNPALSQYIIEGDEKEWTEALKRSNGATSVSIKSKGKRRESGGERRVPNKSKKSKR